MWLTGNPRTKEAPLDTKAFTGEFRADTNFTYSFNKPIDDTISGSSEIFRSGEGGVTPPGGNIAPPGSPVPGWAPDLRKSENRVTAALLVKF